jgi:hypothetical protein
MSNWIKFAGTGRINVSWVRTRWCSWWSSNDPAKNPAPVSELSIDGWQKWAIRCTLLTALLSSNVFSSEPSTVIGTLLWSDHHTDGEYDEDHGGAYFAYDGWVAGALTNSEGNRSVLLGKSWALSKRFSFTIGGANGYEDAGWDGWLISPLLGFHQPVYECLHADVLTNGYVTVAGISCRF